MATAGAIGVGLDSGPQPLERVSHQLLVAHAFDTTYQSFGGGSSSRRPVRAPVLLAGWTHYLAFDLFIGGWEVRDAQRRGIPHLLIVPALVLGPAGLLLYLAMRRLAANQRSYGLLAP